VKRLPEQFDPTNRDEAYLASLLQHAHPFEPSREQTERVWATLERSRARRPRGRMRAPVIAGLLLCGATAASATMSHVWKRWHGASLEEAPADVTATVNEMPLRAPRLSPRTAAERGDLADAPIPLALPAAESNSLLGSAVDTLARPDPATPRANAPRKSVPRSRPTPAEIGDPLASGALMVEAIRERRAGNVARARELATEYRAKNPTGSLQEEALALCMESASTLGDDEAKQLASLYLQRYPRGRFRAPAERVLGSAR
jgi:hypothetical protein